MSALNANPPKTTVNRALLFIAIGVSTVVPLFILGFFFESLVTIFLMPLVVIIVLFMLFIKEKRVSGVTPKGLELLYATLGAFYPSVLVAIILWVIWWVVYGIAVVVFDLNGEIYEDAYLFSSTIFGLLSLGVAIFLARMNWRHLVDQLYPYVGSHSAFAKISDFGKWWLVKRGILFSIIFFFTLLFSIIIPVVFLSEGDDFTMGDEFLFSLTIIFVYLFFISITAWLWLRKPEIPRGIEITNKAIARLLQPLGYKVKTLTEIKNAPTQVAVISDKMTASVDLVALSAGKSMVIDVITDEETLHAPDWVMASEFHTAVRYLKNVLQLPSPVETVAVLVDIIADDSLFLFAEDQNIKVIQLSSEEVVDLMTADMSEQALQNKYALLFSSVSTMSANGSLSVDPVVEYGGRHG
jgi:hypothetical protein